MYLNCHSYYSLRYGTYSVEGLLEKAHELGLKQLALTDINSTSACLDFLRLAPKYNIKPSIGIDFRQGNSHRFILLAKSNIGYQNICRYLSHFLHQKNYKIPERAPYLEDVICIYPFQTFTYQSLDNWEYIGVKLQDLNRLNFSPWVKQQHKLLFSHSISFQSQKAYNTHRLLRAIDNNTLLSKLPVNEQGLIQDQFLLKSQLQYLHQQFPFLLKNNLQVLEQCQISFDFNNPKPKNLKSYTQQEELDFKLLRQLSYDGINYRYPNANTEVYSRIEKELKIIHEKGFVSYFLINWKILKYARNKGYYYVGRGSGANSIIAYLLRITDVDPIELDLYFERFINLYRQNPPDFDIDFSWTDRDDITHFIFNNFKNSALLAVYNTFRYKAAVRELGKVFGLPKMEIDKLSKAQFNYQELDQLSALTIKYSSLIQDFPNYLGIHASGIIISEEPVHSYCATFMPPKAFPTTQIDMVVAEDIGLYKFDILSQRGLGKIKDAVKIVHKNHPEKDTIDIHDIARFKKDKNINQLISEAQAIGCFYVESPAMRMLLKKLRVDNYLGLVAASSVIRPGVSASGMMQQYILRHRYPEKRKDAHPVMLNIMPETYGVMVYQEDVIKVAHYYGGLDLGEADMLRRGMSGKFRSREEFAKVEAAFFNNCKAKGHPEAESKEIWRQIESFAGYAFAKGHSASYAVESYQSLFLKAYYPIEYMTATINNGGGFYRTELYVHEARMHGATIHPPHINISEYHSVCQSNNIYLGFMLLRDLESDLAYKIVNERTQNGLYKNLDDFVNRIPIGLEQLSILIRINAFAFSGKDKHSLLWEAHMKVNKKTDKNPVRNLFQAPVKNYSLPHFEQCDIANAFDEMELLGFPLSSPFNLLEKPPNAMLKHSKDLPKHINQFVSISGYLITVKNSKTSKGQRMNFGTFIDIAGHFIDTVHFPESAKNYPFKGKGIYLIYGKVSEEFDFTTIEVHQMEKLPVIPDPRYNDEFSPRKIA